MTPADLDPKTLGRDHTCPACGATIPKGTNIDDANLRWYKAERSFGHKRPCPPVTRATPSPSQHPLDNVPPPVAPPSKPAPPPAKPPVEPAPDLTPSPGVAKWTATVEQALTDDPAGPTFKLTAFDATSLGAITAALPGMVAVARKAKVEVGKGGR